MSEDNDLKENRLLKGLKLALQEQLGSLKMEECVLMNELEKWEEKCKEEIIEDSGGEDGDKMMLGLEDYKFLDNLIELTSE